MSDYAPGAVITRWFATVDADGPASLTGGAVAVYKDGDSTPITAGVTLELDVDAAGSHRVTVNTGAGVVYSAPSDYAIRITAGATDQPLVGYPVGRFRLVVSLATDVNVVEIAGDSGAAVLLATNVGNLVALGDIEAAILQLQAAMILINADTDQLLTRTPNAAPGAPGGLPTVDAQNRVAGIQGTIGTLDELDAAQDAQHAATHSRLPSALSADGHIRADVQTVRQGGISANPPYSPA